MATKVYVAFAACLGLILSTNHAAATTSVPDSNAIDLAKRGLFDNISACRALSPQSKVHYPFSSTYGQTIIRFMSSSSQVPGCVFVPTLPSEISSALKVIAEKKIPFAVSSGKHASNQGFSSTTGVHISMKGFQHVKLSQDKSYVDIGSGNVWDNVLEALEGSGVNVLTGRVSGVGVGGFITGGGGFSWKTNQHGLTVDSLLHVEMILPDGKQVTASTTSYPDLFFAIKGGGNQFGIIYNFRLKTFPQSAQVYGGMRTYLGGETKGLIKAVNDFSANNKDPKAQIIPAFNHLFGFNQLTLLAFYDGEDPGEAFSAFHNLNSLTDNWKARTFVDLVRSSPVNVTAYQRGSFHTVSLKRYSEPLLQQIFNQSEYWGNRPGRSGTFVSYDVEPFLNYGKHASDTNSTSAWPHHNSPLPLNLYFTWLLPSDDDFYHDAMRTSAKIIEAQARAEGQDVDSFALYPNYAIAGTPVKQLYGSQNAAKLKELKAKYDPKNVMGQTTFFSI